MLDIDEDIRLVTLVSLVSSSSLMNTPPLDHRVVSHTAPPWPFFDSPFSKGDVFQSAAGVRKPSAFVAV